MPSKSKKYFGFELINFASMYIIIQTYRLQQLCGRVTFCNQIAKLSSNTLIPGSQTCSPKSHRKPHVDLMRVYNVSLDMKGDTNNYFSFGGWISHTSVHHENTNFLVSL